MARDTKVQLATEEIAVREALAWRALKLQCEGSLRVFFREAWPQFDSSRYVNNWHLDAMADHLMAVSHGQITRLLINIPPRNGKTNIVSIAWPVWTWAHPIEMKYPLLGPGVRFLCASYGANKAEADGVTARRLIGSDWFRERWGDRVQVQRDRDNQGQYDTTAGGSRISTGIPESLGKGGAIRLVDDPSKPDEVESDLQRESMLRAYNEVWRTRSNDPIGGAEVIVMQRLHENDLSGAVLAENDPALVHLMLPMEFDTRRSCHTITGFTDPRVHDGDLLWPARFDSKWVANQKRRMGPVAWCTPGESPVLMADLSLKPIRDVREGDEIVGFTSNVAAIREGEKFSKRHLKPTRVCAISVSVQPVVKVTLDSGEVIRCTADHNWYTGRGPNDKSHAMYLPAKVGREMYRVCPSRLKEMTDPNDIRAAGWLCGFFDGEGTVSTARRWGGNSMSATIAFSQGTGRNLILCDKLETELTRFGFAWGFSEKLRSDRREPASGFPNRTYWVTRTAPLPVYQRFLHIVQPTKSREQITTGAFTSSMIQGTERVVSIEPDGEETVYGLTTETGNYVVWGLASSNSGQMNQTPVARGGGIIQRDWWKLWPPEGQEDSWTQDFEIDGRTIRKAIYPDFEFVMLACDTAYTEKEENDYSACIAWGVFRDEARNPKIMMIEAWRERLELRALVHKILATARRKGREADAVLVEAKASGLSVMQEMRRLMRDGEFTLFSDVPKGDKLARLHAASPAFSGGLVYAPDRIWSELVISEVASFPRSKFKDLTDCVSSGIKKLRDLGLLQHTDEVKEEREDELMHAGTPRASPREEYGV